MTEHIYKTLAITGLSKASVEEAVTTATVMASTGRFQSSGMLLCTATLAVMIIAQPIAVFASSQDSVRHEQYRMLCSTVNSKTLPKSVVNRYGISVDRTVGILSCVVQRISSGEETRNIDAEVTAIARNFYSVSSTFELRAVEVDRADDRLSHSFIGSYSVSSKHQMTFSITARIKGQDELIHLELIDEKPRR